MKGKWKQAVKKKSMSNVPVKRWGRDRINRNNWENAVPDVKKLIKKWYMHRPDCGGKNKTKLPLMKGLAQWHGHQRKSFQGENLPKPGHKIKWYWVITQRIKYLWVTAATKEWLNKLINKRGEINLLQKNSRFLTQVYCRKRISVGPLPKVHQVTLSDVDSKIVTLQ